MNATGLDGVWPRPRAITYGSGFFSRAAAGAVCLEGREEDVRPARERLRMALGEGWRVTASGPEGAAVWFRLVPHVGGAQSYRLTVGEREVRAEAQDRAGLFYAAVTLSQLLQPAPGLLPVCRIADAPDFPVRGVMLDISRDKVPTLETLFWLVERLADLKINQFQLYTEHTFAYRGHEEVWRDASPMTPEEIRALDTFCRARCVELVPNQNSFGHLERWLTLPRYKELAELPQGGAPLPWGGAHEKPTSLCPTEPRSLSFLAGLYDDLLPNFSSRLFNVGCDETFDLRGDGRSRERVKQVGEGRVYLDFLKRIHGLVAERGRTMQFWGDIIVRHPELVPDLPRDAVALEWGYEADHPFDVHGALFAASGVPYYVCPGTSSWNSLAGRTENMLDNQRSAAESGLRFGACGYLITDWGDGGHWQPLAASLAGFVCGAGLSWCAAVNRGGDVGAAMDAHVAEGMGRVLLDLGNVYLFTGACRGNGTELFHILSKPRARPILKGVTVESLEAALARVDDLSRQLPASTSVLREEVEQVIRLLRAACRRGIALLDGTIDRPDVRHMLAREMDLVMSEHARVWRLRNREGGLQDSLARFNVSGLSPL